MKLTVTMLAAVLSALVYSATALAHAHVSPSIAPAGESQGFTQINLESLTSVMPGPDPASTAAVAGRQWIADRVRNDNLGRAT